MGSQGLVILSLSLHEPTSVGLAQRVVPAWCSPRLGCCAGSTCGSPWSLLSRPGDTFTQ